MSPSPKKETLPILALDIGNTAMTLAYIKGKKIRIIATIKTSLKKKVFIKTLIHHLTKIKSLFAAVVICSVVPSMEGMVKKIIKSKIKKKIYILGKDIKVPIKSQYHPRQIGQDRLVCSYAAMTLYGTPVLIVDLGTATTIDMVSRKKEYKGGIIIPGIEMSADSLSKKTALLPKVPIRRPKSLIGKDTKNSILSGIFYGYGEMIHGLIGLISKRSHGKPKVIVTGGYLHLMKNYIATKVGITIFDKDLVFKGIGLIWEKCRIRHHK